MEKTLQLSLQEMQGKLFTLSAKLGYDSAKFIKAFMNSDVAKGLDSEFDFTQWAGKEYLLERIEQELPQACVQGPVYSTESLYWIGYIYRFWHFYSPKTSREIYKIASATTMNSLYLGYHTLSPEMAIDLLEHKTE